MNSLDRNPKPETNLQPRHCSPNVFLLFFPAAVPKFLQHTKKIFPFFSPPLFVAQVFLQPLLPRSSLFLAGCRAICSRTGLTEHEERTSKEQGPRERAEPNLSPFFFESFIVAVW
ncbi:hypothetical protein SLEP1_g59619 [Rubroshorea leprosula]|uniref:Uncharacterized protein n=1 Tax=Rubroshorea leprosula TaxID=152421 RepID=A0AAV5MWH1_9ROSI|nr:hypothetical protein SLEP1_g59619 [Rubroshorea leprosula]